MSGLYSNLPMRVGHTQCLPLCGPLPPARGRMLSSTTLLVTDDARPELIWKFTPWEKAELVEGELDIYARLQALEEKAGIVQLLGVGGTHEYLVRAYERAHHGELHRFLRNEKGEPHPPPPEQTRAILAQIARAMVGLHALDIVHRDIKAENILVFRTLSEHAPEVKLADFDRAIVLPTDAQKEEPVGSLFHMAPELLAWKPYDRRVDIYAFGILMHEVAHGGARPYRDVATGLPGSLDATEFARKVIEDGFRPQWHQDDTQLQALAARCLMADPQQRPDFPEILHELENEPVPRMIHGVPRPVPQLPRSMGMASDAGRHRRSMEDAASILQRDDMLILAVFDGLGGARSSQFAARHLPLVLAEQLGTATNCEPDYIESAIREAFAATQARLRRIDPHITCGTTATIAVVCKDDIHLAWVGDSPVGIFRASPCDDAMTLTVPHHPSQAHEAERIIASGGEVRRELRMMDSGEMVGWGPLRLFVPHMPVGIAVSRALGVPDFGPALSNEPDILRFERGAGDDILFLGSDGVFEVLSLQQARNIVMNAESLAKAADAIIAAVLEAGAPDNATIILFDMRDRMGRPS